MPRISGFLNLIKPSGPTSHDLVVRLRRLLPGLRLGHLGTLDPAAGGVLPMALGSATRLSAYAGWHPKTYRVELLLGLETTSGDLQGSMVSAALPGRVVNGNDIREVLRQFTGTIRQRPPRSSAVHVAGRRSYEWERAGFPVEPPERRVTVYEWRWLAVFPAGGGLLDPAKESAIRLAPGDRLLFEVLCSAGTYVRALARDIGRVLGIGATVSYLLRTAVGPFTLTNAIPVGRLGSDPSVAESVVLAGLLPPATIWPPDRPRLRLAPDLVKRLRQGQAVRYEESRLAAAPARAGHEPAGSGQEVLIEDGTGEAVAIGLALPGGFLRAKRILT